MDAPVTRNRRLLLLYNCQAQGLASCLQLLAPGLDVEHYDALVLQKQLPDLASRAEHFDHIVITPQVRAMVGEEVAGRPQVVWMPHLVFSGYHPDLCYLAAAGPLATGVSASYHSALAYTGFRCGLDVEATVRLYRPEVYAALGYYDMWNDAREGVLIAYDRHGFDLRESFLRWSRRGPFMHTVNHPKIEVLMDFARLLLRKLGIGIVESGIVPHDNLTNGPVFPVFPEIGARLGIGGSYLFKNGGAYRVMDLESYVAASHAIYRQAGDAEPSYEPYLPLLDRAKSVVESMR
jgi:hypothetical protein